MSIRIQFNRRGPTVPCEVCGYSTVHIAEMVADDGTALGRTLVCTFCQRSRHRVDRASLPVTEVPS